VTDHFTKVAEMIEDARRGFLTSDEQLLAGVNKVPTRLPASTTV
jgi:phosphate uptake regulator